MSKLILRALTPSSWLLIENGERMGLVSQSNEELVVIGKKLPGKYASLKDLESKAGSKLTIEQMAEPEPEKEQGAVEGYPIKHAEWHNVMLDPVPSYTRTSKSNNRYGAGYYALKFGHGWTAALCPKLATLAEYEHIGPFRTKLEMQHQISAKNKAINV